MSERENVRPRQPESVEAARDPLLDAFFRLRKPEQVIQFYFNQAGLLMLGPENTYTPKQSLEIVFQRTLPALCMLSYFYPENSKQWAIALRFINQSLTEGITQKKC